MIDVSPWAWDWSLHCISSALLGVSLAFLTLIICWELSRYVERSISGPFSLAKAVDLSTYLLSSSAFLFGVLLAHYLQDFYWLPWRWIGVMPWQGM